MNSFASIVVFDVDETLGHFVELGIFWEVLNSIYGMRDKYHFFELLDLFPEFLRPEIISILSYIIEQKQKGLCDKIFIFTNNQGPRSWVEMITEYFNYKLREKVFDNIVSAFKVHGEIIEWCRTSNDKKVDDLLKCCNIPKQTQICFIDDQEHPLMVQSNVYYINVKPYYYSIPYYEMVNRYSKAFISLTDSSSFKRNMLDQLYSSEYEVVLKPPKEMEVDKVISKQILFHLEEFFIHTNHLRKPLKLHRKHKTLKKKKRK